MKGTGQYMTNMFFVSEFSHWYGIWGNLVKIHYFCHLTTTTNVTKNRFGGVLEQ
jgi:hypothetical protein